jgi:hypothetical protein
MRHKESFGTEQLQAGMATSFVHKSHPAVQIETKVLNPTCVKSDGSTQVTFDYINTLWTKYSKSFAGQEA